MLFGLMSCKEALAQMNGYLDRQLAPEEMEAVRCHVKMCHACALKFAEGEVALLEETRAKMERIAQKDEMISRMSTILDDASHKA